MSLVMIVEDEAVLRSSMARGIRKLAGIETAEAGTLAEARRQLAACPPQLILSDIDLPDGSGIEILSELERQGSRIPVVFISAYLDAWIERIPTIPEIEVHGKPVGLEELRDIVTRRLNATAEETGALPFSVADYLQLACLGQHSVLIEVRATDGSLATLEIVKGNIWSASDAQGSGIDAFRRILFAPNHSAHCRSLQSHSLERTIFDDWQRLLMDAARLHDETAHEQELLKEATAQVDDVAEALASATENAFNTIWEEAISAMIERDYQRALKAFLQADAIAPGDRKVAANLARLKDMGVTLSEMEPTAEVHK
ncbi:MAG: response regulator [Acidobacteriota bacterium]